jgi:hypothetical protein
MVLENDTVTLPSHSQLLSSQARHTILLVTLQCDEHLHANYQLPSICRELVHPHRGPLSWSLWGDSWSHPPCGP